MFDTFVVLRKRYFMMIAEKKKSVFLLKSNSDCVGIQIPAGVWHRIEVLESGTVIFEAKDGTYEPISTENII